MTGIFVDETTLLSSLVTGNEIKEFINNVTFPFSSQDGARAYHDVHSQRYAITLNALNKLSLDRGAAALELAASPYGMTAWLAEHKFSNLTLATYADYLGREPINGIPRAALI